MPGPLTLWYRQPADQWVEALPVGNGRLAAMVFGGVRNERLQLNEDTLWSGGPYDPANPDALAALPRVRRLIFNRQYTAAHALIGEKMMAKPLREMPFQPLGDLTLTIPAGDTVEQYRRALDLDTAIARVTYASEGVTYTRDVFSSPVDQVVVIRLTADRPGQVSVTAGLTTPQEGTTSVEGDSTLVVKGRNGEAQGIKGALTFQARARVLAEGGRTVAANDSVAVAGADAVTILVAAATSYRSYKDVDGDPQAITTAQIDAAASKTFETLRAAHVAEHQRLFRRVSLDLGRTDAASLPTDERIKHFADGNDPQLAALYFQFGRYLLISSSRPGSQPANLQGDLERSGQAALGQQVHDQHQHRDELLAGRGRRTSRSCVEPLSRDGAATWRRPARARRKDHVRRARLGGAPQHRPVARDRARRRPAVRHVADRRRVAVPAPVGALRIHAATAAISRASIRR